ncbi:MAG: WecB/TagA/CpsF family glycosyltransferase [Candidatus Dormibacteraceae bacterium]
MPAQRVFGVAVDEYDMEGAVQAILDLLDAHRQDPGRPAALVVTVNPEFLMRARKDPAVRRALGGATVRLADGSGVVWALRRRGRPATRVAGADLVPPLATALAGPGYSLYLLGAGPGVAETAASRLRARHPTLQIVGAEAGSAREADDEAQAARVRASGADLLLVAFGAPKQELWIARNRDRLGVGVAIGVGGTLDFLAGRVRRAPPTWRRAHLEWTWRLLREPWRARRMAVLPGFALLVLLGRDR